MIVRIEKKNVTHHLLFIYSLSFGFSLDFKYFDFKYISHDSLETFNAFDV